MKKLFLNLLFILCFTGFYTLKAQPNAWINEFHYDNTGADVGEFIEVVIENASSYTLSDFYVGFYNGANSAEYTGRDLSTFTVGATVGNFTFYYVYHTIALQNGSPDGLALIYNLTDCIEFISYEGTFTGNSGPVNGITSVDIGVSELGNEPAGLSLQRTGSGTNAGAFTWTGPLAESPGAINAGQSFGGPPSPVITVSETALSGFNYEVGNGPSAHQTFTVSGANLVDPIYLARPTDYEISIDNTDYSQAVITLAQTGGTVSATTIYARMRSGRAIGEYNNQNITLSSTDASIKTVTLNGYVEGKQTSTLPYTNEFTSGFGKINLYDAGGIRYWGISSGAAMINGFPNDDAVDVDWMILPSVNFSLYSQVELYFDIWWRYGNQDANNYLKVLYSNNYAGFGNPSGATWTEIPFTIPAEQTWTEIGPLDLSAITATDVHIAFKYQSDNAARQWIIDNINLQQYTPPPTVLANAWINEIHYDNSGVDVDESIEVAVERVDTLTLADITVTLYNGGDGTPYNTKTLAQFTQGATVGDYTFFYYNYTVNAQSIQNGPDGIALDWKGNLIQFISYGGSFNGIGGPANGVASTNINLTEPSTNPPGYSIQLVGTGLNYGHFQWIDPPASFGNLNNNQLLAPPPPPVPVDWRYILLAFMLIAGITVYRKLR